MKSFAQKIVVLAMVTTTVLISSLAMAAAVSDVANTKHNLAVGGSSVGAAALGTGAVQVCVFCHTPHNAAKTGPLWNKANTTAPTTFLLYTSSGSLTQVTKRSALTGNSPSLLCLGCHDGKTAMNILHNTSYGVDAASAGVTGYPAGAKVITATNGGPNAAYMMPAPLPDIITGEGMTPEMRTGGVTGNNLTDDHPVGFSYSAVYGERSAGLHTLADAKTAGVRFFGASNNVECSTCHNPHIDSSSDLAFKPFLVKSNTNSALCLTCHDK